LTAPPVEERRARLAAAHLYAITADQESARLATAAEACLRGGAQLLQLRHRALARGELLNLARRLHEVTAAAGVLLIVNDHLDIALLAEHFLRKFAAAHRKPVPRLLPRALDLLETYDWPGNVRQLENCIERAVALGDGKIIDVGDLPPAVLSAAPATEIPITSVQSSLSSNDLEDIERATILRVFEQVNGDKVVAGKMLGISRATLYRKLKRYNISPRPDLGASPGIH